MFGNNNLTTNMPRSNGPSLNTRLTTLYGDDSLLTIGAWNYNLSLKFYPATGKNADGITQYAQDNTNATTVVLTPDNASALLDGIEKDIIPALNAKTNASVAVKTGALATLKYICVAVESGVPYIYVTKNTMNGVTDSTNIITHHFPSKELYKNYNPVNGVTSVEFVYTGFNLFVERLKSVIERLVPDVAHSINYSNMIKSNSKSDYSSAPKYEAPVSNFEGSSSLEFLPFT